MRVPSLRASPKSSFAEKWKDSIDVKCLLQKPESRGKNIHAIAKSPRQMMLLKVSANLVTGMGNWRSHMICLARFSTHSLDLEDMKA